MRYWQRLAQKIDALTLRERVIVFAMAALVLVALFNTLLLDAQYAEQNRLSQKIRQQRTVIAGMQAEIQQKATLQAIDPDSANQVRAQQLQRQITERQATLREMQKGLVSADKMSILLEDILRQNNTLKLVSVKTLPAISLGEQMCAENAKQDAKGVNPPEARQAADSIYKHGVEIVIQGRYFDIMNYLAQLEAMPWQLFWGQAALNADAYPRSTLTLRLFTLSLDQKWLNL